MLAHVDEAVYGIQKRRTLWEVLISEKYFKWTLIIPLLVTLAVFMLYPMFYCLYYSTQHYCGIGASQFLGWENYRIVLHDVNFWQVLGRTFQILAVSIVVELVLGMSIALFFNRGFRGQNVVRGLCLLPLLMSPLAMSMMWKFLLQWDFGPVNQLLLGLGLPKVMWWSMGWAIYTIAFINIWQWLPFSIFVLLAGLRTLPRDAFEAARVDGASAWYTFRRLTLPMLMPLIMIIVLLRTMWLIRIFDALYGTTRGGVGTETLDWMIYRVSFVFFDIGIGSTLALVSLFLTIIICAVLFRRLMLALGALK